MKVLYTIEDASTGKRAEIETWNFGTYVGPVWDGNPKGPFPPVKAWPRNPDGSLAFIVGHYYTVGEKGREQRGIGRVVKLISESQPKGVAGTSVAPAPAKQRPAQLFPDDIPPEESFWEGATAQATVNRYERDAGARRACIAHFGAVCKVCDFDFEATYGEMGRGFIHVHHTRPLSEIREGYAVDPKQDLIPVCPNCHAMLHQAKPPLNITELQSRLKRPTAKA
jgi:5-methylcytosine-specific restriction protein A